MHSGEPKDHGVCALDERRLIFSQLLSRGIEDGPGSSQPRRGVTHTARPSLSPLRGCGYERGTASHGLRRGLLSVGPPGLQHRARRSGLWNLSYAVFRSEVQCGQRVACAGIDEKQNLQAFTAGAGAGTGFGNNLLT